MKVSRTVIVAAVFAFAACSDGDKAPTVLEDGAECVAASENEICEDFCLEEFADGTVVEGGMCTSECEWLEDKSDTCPEGQICLRFTRTDEYACFVSCYSDEDCRDSAPCACLDIFCTERACLPSLIDPEDESLTLSASHL